MNVESIESLRQIVREELHEVPINELRWAFSSRPTIPGKKGRQPETKSWWKKLLDRVLGRASTKAKTEKVLRVLLSHVNNMIETGSFPHGFQLSTYEDMLANLNPDLTDVVGHLFMKIEDLQGTMRELHNQLPVPSILRDDEEAETTARERKKLRRVARDLIRGIQRDSNRMMVRRSRRGARRYAADEPVHHTPYF